ncbi:tail fiber domain-containing protein [Subsaxibacter sp. CAU 1640]|uniref:tail fiber domain-containing protein n=1 Tax=Subsaxibacter sp. CAU 1640 TaxID=2933271 RepID=UPI002005058F|nr:tail fiber domain-containing protein [Subsaxibacter sp. CAU 1640]MCK7590252.1 tail fiber domain-containing protein [Subsaxibacter sp. CAU 1640]
MKTTILSFWMLITINVVAQVGIGTTTPNAQLDIQSTNQANPSNTDGILIPKIDTFPTTNPGINQNGMLVFLTTTFGANTPGFYYWNHPTTAWFPIGNNSNSGWNLNGNLGTDSSTNFIGTIDAQDIIFKRNNIVSGKISTSNTSLGFASLLNNPSGSTAFGNTALQLNSGNNNSGFGNQVLRSTGTGGFNSGFGANTMRNNTSGANNTGVGFEALLSNTVGNDNTSLGFKADVSTNNLSNATAIGAKSFVGANNSLVLGSINGVNGATSNVNVGVGISQPLNKLHLHTNSSSELNLIQFSIPGSGNTNTDGFLIGINQTGEAGIINTFGGRINFNDQLYIDGDRLGIGITNPSEKLHILGRLRMVDGNQAVGRIMVSDANGTASWQEIGSRTWSLTGNAGTAPGTNFIGTTDDQDVVFKRNNTVHGRLGFSNTSFGRNTGISGSNNSAFGMNSMSSATGVSNSAYGINTLVNSSGSSNNAFGQASLFTNTTGTENTAFGSFSLNANLTGVQNSAFGNETLRNNTTGSSNVSVGYSSLNRNTTGNNNTATGYEALSNNTTASDNSAFGHFALRNNSTGTNNVGVGNMSLQDNDNGSFNTAVGYSSQLRNFSGSNNVSVGFNSLQLNSGGNSNTAIGSSALQDNRASSNTAVGRSALLSNTTGTSNTATGVFALTNNLTGSFNSAYGNLSLTNNVSGVNNSAFGYQSQQNTTSGQSNSSFGQLSLSNNTTGGFNTALGRQAMTTNTTGGSNTALGALANVSINNLTNATAIGARAEVGADNSLVLGSINGVNGATASVNVGIGTTTPTATLQVEGAVTFNDNAANVDFRVESLNNVNMLRVDASDDSVKIGTAINSAELLRVGQTTGDGIQIGSAEIIEDGGVNIITIGAASLIPDVDATRNIGSSTLRWNTVFAANGVTTTSDAREKQEIKVLRYGLDKIMQLQPKTYQWIDPNIDNHNTHLGFMAQDLKKILPEVVVDKEWKSLDEKGSKDWVSTERLGVNYSEIIPVLVKGIQEQQEIIFSQSKEIEELKNINASILKRLEKLENQR